MARKVAEVTAPEGGGGGDGLGPRWQLWRRRRFVLASLAFWGLVSMYTTRINFSVAIVAMTSGSGACHRAALPANASASAPVSANASAHAGECSERGEFDWDSRTQGLLLSGFFYGYLASQMPAGWLVARAGAAALLGAGIAGSALLTLLGPVAARVGGAPLLLATRIVSGLLQGVVFPCLNAIWARWAPPLERSRLATTVASGCNVGTVIVLPLSGLLAAHVGWPSIFYVFGAGGVLWWALWWAQTADSPERDRRVSDKERRFIEDALGVDTATAKVSFHPWRRFFTSPAYLGKLVAHFCANWGFYTLVTQMPMYLKDTLGFDLRKNDLYTSDKNKSDKQLEEHAQEFNVSNVNNRVRDSSRGPKERKRKNKNRKNKQSRRRSKQDKNASGKNKKRKSERKMRRGRKQKEHNLRKNDLPEIIHSEKHQTHTTEEMPVESRTGMTVNLVKKADDLFSQVHQSVPMLSISQNANETNSIFEVDENFQETADAKNSDVSGDNVLLPILHTDVISRESNKINIQKNVSGTSSQQKMNTSVDVRETESATVELDINQSSDSNIKFFDEHNSTRQQVPLDSNPRSELDTANGSFQDHETREYDALNEIVGDISCLAGTFLPAPPSSHAAIRYVRTQTATTANLVAEYECEPKHHLENHKIFQVICSERKWMGTVPSCVPDVPVIENRSACHEGKGGCDHLCEIIGNSTVCSCYKGFRLENGICRDVNECEMENGGCDSGCRNTPGSHHCTCPPGLRLADNRMTCIDIDECSYDELQSEQCEFGCVNTVGSYHCLGPQNDDTLLSPTTEILVACPVGFYLDAEGNCKDVDECKEKTSGCEQGCLNTKGSFQCYCGLGYKLSADNRTCIEAKETVCPPLESPPHGYWECARHLIRTKKSKFPWMKRTRVVNHAGAICQLKCPPGYVLEGEYRKTCGQDSKWKGPDDGTCVRKLDYMFNVILKA